MTSVSRKKGARGRAAERRRQRARRRRVGLIVAGVVGIGLVAGLIYLAVAGPRAASNLPGEAVATQGNQHITPPDTYGEYNTTPPTSGPHYDSLAPWGISSVPLANESQVHNLEDGGVGVQYDCPDSCPELVAQLESVVSQYPERVFMAPYPGLENTIALTAWGRIDAFDEFDEQRIHDFIRAYRGVDHHTG